MPVTARATATAPARQAAEALVDWLATDPTGSGDPDFLIMGDLNSYAMEDPIDAIKAGSDDIAGTGDDYTNLIAEYEGPYAYSYTFDGQAGYLDHALANSTHRRPGDRRGRMAHQLRRARRARLRHELQAAGAGGVVRARPVPDLGSRRRRGRSRPHPLAAGRHRRRVHHGGGHDARGERAGSPVERQSTPKAGRSRHRSSAVRHTAR